MEATGTAASTAGAGVVTKAPGNLLFCVLLLLIYVHTATMYSLKEIRLVACDCLS